VKLKSIVIKEVKEYLRDKSVIASILIGILMFPLIGSVTKISMEAHRGAIGVAVLNLDRGNMSALFLDYLNSSSFIDIIYYSEDPNADPLRILSELHSQGESSPLLIVIPGNFTECILADNATINVHLYVYGRVSLTMFRKVENVKAVLQAFREFVVEKKLANRTVDISTSYTTVFRNEVYNVEPTVLLAPLYSLLFTLPTVVLVVLISVTSVVSIVVAKEKEAKTLETLLTTPVSRFQILLGKILGSIVIAFFFTLMYSFGFLIYAYSIGGIQPQTTAGAEIGSEIVAGILKEVTNPLFLATFFVVLLVTVSCGIAISIILSIFAEDVKGAQALSSMVIPLIIVPAMFSFMTDISTLPPHLQWFLYALPFTLAFVAPLNALNGDYTGVAIGLAYPICLTLALLYVTAKIFSSEKILTIKLVLRRLKR